MVDCSTCNQLMKTAESQSAGKVIAALVIVGIPIGLIILATRK